MKWVKYAAIALIYYALTVIGGLIFEDLGIIFELIAAIAITQLGFIWPGTFYLIAYAKYGDLRGKEVGNHTFNKINAIG